MPRRRTTPIPGLTYARGVYVWKPSPRLRSVARAVTLGDDRARAETEALRLQRQAETALQAATPSAPASGAGPAKGNRAPKLQPLARPSSVTHLANLYRASPDWLRLAAATRETYDYELRRLEQEFGDRRATALSQADAEAWLDTLRWDRPEDARHFGGRARALYNWAARKGHIAYFNPFARARLGAGQRRGSFCPSSLLPTLLAAASAEGAASLGTAFVIGFFGIMRVSDVLASTRAWLPHAATGQVRLCYAPSKSRRLLSRGRATEKRIDAACPGNILKRLLTHPPAPTPQGWLVTRESTGQRWHRHEAARMFARIVVRAARDAPALNGLQLRDARRSGFTFAHQRGMPIELIRTLSGHSLKTAYEMAEHYLVATTADADKVVKAMEMDL